MSEVRRYERVLTPVRKADYRYRTADPSDVGQIVDGDCDVVDERGTLRAAYRELPEAASHGDVVERIRNALPQLPFADTARTDGLVTRICIFGYHPRIALRNDYCGPTALAMAHPELDQALRDGAALGAAVYSLADPTTFSRHLRLVDERVRNAYHLPNSPFTSGIVNENNPLTYHRDSGNFPGTMSAMLTIRRGPQHGGALLLPEYDIGVQVRDGSLFVFDGQTILHGVTPIALERASSRRWTIVYYSLQAMWACLDPSAEVTRANERRLTIEHRKVQP